MFSLTTHLMTLRHTLVSFHSLTSSNCVGSAIPINLKHQEGSKVHTDFDHLKNGVLVTFFSFKNPGNSCSNSVKLSISKYQERFQGVNLNEYFVNRGMSFNSGKYKGKHENCHVLRGKNRKYCNSSSGIL